MDTKTYQVGIVRPEVGKHPWLIDVDKVEGTRDRGLQVEVIDVDIAVDDQVTVHAFGRMRPGRVTKLGRTRVTVDYQQNAQGGRNERAFRISELGSVRTRSLLAPAVKQSDGPESLKSLLSW